MSVMLAASGTFTPQGELGTEAREKNMIFRYKNTWFAEFSKSAWKRFASGENLLDIPHVSSMIY